MEPWTNSFHGIERLPALTVHAHDVCFFERHLGSCKPFSTPPPSPWPLKGWVKGWCCWSSAVMCLMWGSRGFVWGRRTFSKTIKPFEDLVKPWWSLSGHLGALMALMGSWNWFWGALISPRARSKYKCLWLTPLKLWRDSLFSGFALSDCFVPVKWLNTKPTKASGGSVNARRGQRDLSRAGGLIQIIQSVWRIVSSRLQGLWVRKREVKGQSIEHGL